METTYVYSVAADFPNGIDAAYLSQQIALAYPDFISQQLYDLLVEGDVVTIRFSGPLTVDEKAYLDSTIIANHVPPTTGTYATLITDLPDAQAVRIAATNPAGGILISAQEGGVEIVTTNAIRMEADADSYLETASGNVSLRSTTGLANVDGGSGVNVGNADFGGSTINVGTRSDAVRAVTVGTLFGASSVDVNAGTGGFAVNTAAGGAAGITTTDAPLSLAVQSAGVNGYDLTLGKYGVNTGRLVLASAGTTADAILLGAANGGLTGSIGAGGIALNTTGAASIAADQQLLLFSPQTAGGSITLNASAGGLGLYAGVYGASLDAAGSGALFVGRNPDTGDVALGASESARRVVVGTPIGAGRLTERYGTGGSWRTQRAHVAYADADSTATAADVVGSGILTMELAAGVARTLTLPSASEIVAGAGGVGWGWSPTDLRADDSIRFRVINTTDPTVAATPVAVTVVPGAGGTLVGDGAVAPGESVEFILRLTSVAAGVETYTLYP